MWSTDLADLQLLSSYNKGIRLLLPVVGIFSKYAWAIHFKDKKGGTLTKAF